MNLFDTGAHGDITYPHRPGAKASGTSQAAADAVTPRAPTLRCRVLAALHTPRTADEVADILQESVLAVRPRVAELRLMGLIKDTGIRRRNRSGCTAAVWVAVKE